MGSNTCPFCLSDTNDGVVCPSCGRMQIDPENEGWIYNAYGAYLGNPILVLVKDICEILLLITLVMIVLFKIIPEVEKGVFTFQGLFPVILIPIPLLIGTAISYYYNSKQIKEKVIILKLSRSRLLHFIDHKEPYVSNSIVDVIFRSPESISRFLIGIITFLVTIITISTIIPSVTDLYDYAKMIHGTEVKYQSHKTILFYNELTIEVNGKTITYVGTLREIFVKNE